MKPVEPEELSALLDDELPPARAREIEAQMQSDPALRDAYEALAGNDAAWRAAAATAAFAPAVQQGAKSWRPYAAVLALAAALIVLRMAPKLLEAPQLGWLAHALALAALRAGLVWIAGREMQPPRANVT
jgi:anti-sigma factor RsiW